MWLIIIISSEILIVANVHKEEARIFKISQNRPKVESILTDENKQKKIAKEESLKMEMINPHSWTLINIYSFFRGKIHYLKTGCAGSKGTKVSRERRDNCMSCTAAAPEHAWIVDGASTNISPFLIGFTRFQAHTLVLSTTCAHTVPLCGTTMLFS